MVKDKKIHIFKNDQWIIQGGYEKWRETFFLSGMCSPLSIDQTKSNFPSENGWFSASATSKETCRISPSSIVFLVINIRCFDAGLQSWIMISISSCETQIKGVVLGAMNNSFNRISIWIQFIERTTYSNEPHSILPHITKQKIQMPHTNRWMYLKISELRIQLFTCLAL